MAKGRATEPTIADWRRLYGAAARLQEVEPWQRFTDVDLFAVVRPGGAIVHYCSILGAAGELFGLVAYRGLEGLRTFAVVVEEAADPDETYLLHDCLSFTLGNRSDVDARDRAVHTALNLRFRGTGKWPVLRSREPIYLPRHLDKEEARALTDCIEQACVLSGEIEAGGTPAVREGEVPARIADRTSGWRTGALLLPELPPFVGAVDPARISRIIGRCSRVRQSWEVRVVILAPIAEERPGRGAYFARLLLCVDKESGFVLRCETMGLKDTPADAFLKMVAATGLVPQELHLTSPLLAAQLLPVAGALGIKVHEAKRLPEVDRATRSLRERFGHLD